METATMSLFTKKNEVQQVMREKGKDNIQVKIINEEIDETNNQIREFKVHLDNNNTKMISLIKRREYFNNEWKQAGHKELALELLGHIMKENIILVENLEFQRKEQKADLQIKIKDMQVSKLSEQLKIRDEIIQNAKKRLHNEANEIDDPRIIQVDELVSTTSILPPINNNTLGKASGALIKQLLDNLNGEQKTKPSQLAY